MGPGKRRFKLIEQNINITPLMDVLTVLLFFLIKIFTINSMNISVSKDIVLPQAKTKNASEEAVTLVVSKSGIWIDNQLILSMRNNKFQDKDLANGILVNLEKYLGEQLKKRNNIYEEAQDISLLPPGKLLIQADKKLPFSILKYVLATASMAGYSDYQFLVVNP